MRGKKLQQKHENYTPEAAWTSHEPVDDLDPPTFQALSCAKTRHPMVGDWTCKLELQGSSLLLASGGWSCGCDCHDDI